MHDQSSIFRRLMDVIRHRKVNRPERSYTTSLFEGGVDTIGEKILEEAAEFVEAAREHGPEAHQHVVHEAADLIYHLFVMLGHRDVMLSDVEAELGQRFGVSGLDEKASRSHPSRSHPEGSRDG